MLQVRYHENFKGFPQILLIAGSSNELHEVAALLHSWTGKKMDFIVTLKSISTVRVYGIKKLFIESDDKIEESISGSDGSDFFLLLSKSDKTKIPGLIESLRSLAQPGHQYLSTKGQSIRLMFSKDEYTSEKERDIEE